MWIYLCCQQGSSRWLYCGRTSSHVWICFLRVDLSCGFCAV